MKGRDLPTNRESQTESAIFVSGLLGGEIGLENSFKVFRRDSGALVDNPHAQPVAGSLRFYESNQFYADFRAVRGSIDCIRNHVYKETLDEDGIHLHERLAPSLQAVSDVLSLPPILASVLHHCLDHDVEP